MYKKLLSMLLVSVMTLSLAACAQPGSVDEQPGGNDPATSQNNGDNTETQAPEETKKPVEYTTYTEVYSSELGTLNYLSTTTTAVSVLAGLCVDSLVEHDQYGIMRPCLATDWEISNDATVYTFHLKQGIIWYTCDGEEYAELKAKDFVAAAEWILNAANASKVANTWYNNIVGAKAYFDGETTDFSTVGIKALDDYTVEYTLLQPVPYFLKMVSNNVWYPAQADFLAECGDKFGTSNDMMLYCGAYILKTFEPEYQRVLEMNENYWNKDIISIRAIKYKYNKEASANGPELYLRGETDKVSLGTDIIEEWKADPELWKQVHRSQYTNMSYWMAFNFNPTYEEEYAPSDWLAAINNRNFRKALFYAYDRYAATMTLDAYTYQEKVLNTYTRPGLVTVGDTDYLEMSGLDEYFKQENLFNVDEAIKFKEAAIAELTGKVTFPIQITMPYNVSNNATTKRVQVVEQQMEGVLGTDFIDIILIGYSGSSFNAEVRNPGKWSMIELGWGADYADPMSAFDPLLVSSIGKNWGSIYLATEYYDEALGYGTFEKMALEANTIVNDLPARYEAFAAAEKFLLDEAFLIPAYKSAGGYQANKLHPFSGWTSQMGEYGLRKLKGAVVMDHSMSLEEYAQAQAEYIEARTEARLAAAEAGK